MLDEPEFESVLTAAREGADWAWARIYRDLAPDVLRYLRAHRANEPEDVLGETFVQVVRKIGDFEGDARSFRSWVFTIAHNRLLDEWRRNKRDLSDAVEHDTLSALPAHHDPERDVIETLTDAEVREMIERLSLAQRDVIFLRVIAGLSIEETAAVTGRTPGAVKSLQFRGLAAIRREISAESPNNP